MRLKGAGMKKRFQAGIVSICLLLVVSFLFYGDSGETPELAKSVKSAVKPQDTSEDKEENKGDALLKRLSHSVGEYDESEKVLIVKPEYTYEDSFPTYDESSVKNGRLDDKGRLAYVVNTMEGSSYCEESIARWNEEETAARIYQYKAQANQFPYKDGFSRVTGQFLFSVYDYTFSQNKKVLSVFDYSRDIGNDAYGYSSELMLERAYLTEYGGDLLRSQLNFYNWVYPEGAWDYEVYRYDDTGRCVGKITVQGTGNDTDQGIVLEEYVIDKEKNQTEYSKYEVTGEYEFVCEDNSRYFFYPEEMNYSSSHPVVQKIQPDGTKGYRLAYYTAPEEWSPEAAEKMKMKLLPEEMENGLDEHTYVVKEGDTLSKIAKDYYGDERCSEFIYWSNLTVIGEDEDVILPGMKLYIPALVE